MPMNDWFRILLTLCVAIVPGGALGQELPPVESLPAPPAGLWYAEVPAEGGSRQFMLILTAHRMWHGVHPLYGFSGQLRSGGLLCEFDPLDVPWPDDGSLSLDCRSFSQGRHQPNGSRVELTFTSHDREVTVVWRHDGASTILPLRRLPTTGKSPYIGDWSEGPSPLSGVLHVYENPNPPDPHIPASTREEFDKDHLLGTFDDPFAGFYGELVGLGYGRKKDPDAFTFTYWGAGHELWVRGRFDAKAQEIRGADWRGGSVILKRVEVR